LNESELDRQQVRGAIRQMDNEHIFYLLDDAISVLSPAQHSQLIAPYYANPEQVAAHGEASQSLLAEVLAFQTASVAGGYYQEIPNAARNRAENSRGTLSWIADFRRLLDGCVTKSNITSSRDACQAFQILFALLDRLDDETAEEILFAEECGSWMMGIEWKRVLPAWFKALAATADLTEYGGRVEAIINRHCHGQESEIMSLARSVETSVRNNTEHQG
jgi:hypothetical protein